MCTEGGKKSFFFFLESERWVFARSEEYQDENDRKTVTANKVSALLFFVLQTKAPPGAEIL